MPSNAALKQFASLKMPKFRQKYGQFTVEGRKAVGEVFHSSMKIDTIVATPAYVEKYHPIFPVEVISESDYSRLSNFDTPPGVMAIVQTEKFTISQFDLSQAVTLALDGISDPGNLGTILRTADWYGIQQVLLSNNCTDVYNHKCLAATMGSFIRMKFLYTDLHEILKNQNTYGCFLEGENLHIHSFTYPAIVVIGSESHGISPEVESILKTKLTIPSFGKAESLNAAIAAGIVMDHFVRNIPT